MASFLRFLTKKRRMAAFKEMRLKARAAIAEGEFETALRLSFEILDQAPEDLGAARLITRVTTLVEERQNGFDLAERIRDGVSDRPVSLALYAGLLLSCGAPDEARRFAELALRRDPDLVPAYCVLSLIQARAHRSAEALATVDAALARLHGDHTLLRHKAMLLVQLGDYEAAWACYREILETHPTDLLTLNALVALEYNLSNPRAARKILDEIDHDLLVTEPRLFDFACFYLRENRVDEAGQLLEKALVTGQESERIRGLGVAVAVKAGQGDTARRHVERLPVDALPDTRFLIVDDLIAEAGADRLGFGSLAEIGGGLFSRKAMIERAPETALAEQLERDRALHQSVRFTPNAQKLDTEQPISVSLLCPIHRPSDLGNLVKQIHRQTWRHGETLVGLHTDQISADEIKALWCSDLTLRVIDCSDLTWLGQVLNRLISKADGEILMRFDADDIYLPDYCTTTVCSMEHHQADVAGRRSVFRYYKRSRALCFPIGEYPVQSQVHWDAVAGGGTLSARRAVMADVPFQEFSNVAEDQIFYRTCLRLGYRLFNLDPFNHVNVRGPDSSDHTWKISELEMLFRLEQGLAGMEADIDRIVAG